MPGRIYRRWRLALQKGYSRLQRMPHSLRGQFALALLVLSLLILASGVAAVYALRSAANVARQLAEERLVRMQGAQNLLQRTLLIERATYQLLMTASPETVRVSYADIVEQLESFDREVETLADANYGAAALDLYQSSQLFRNTANVVAQLRDNMLQTDLAFAKLLQDRIKGLQSIQAERLSSVAIALYRLQDADSREDVQRLGAQFLSEAQGLHPLPDSFQSDLAALRSSRSEPDSRHADSPFSLRMKLLNERDVLQRFHKELQHQAEAMVAAARSQSASLDSDYRLAVHDLVQTSNRNQRWILALLASSLVFAWLVVRVCLGQNILLRLHQISHYLRRGKLEPEQLETLVQGRDEIADMARAVRQFLKDRHELEQRTEELSFAREQLIEQGRVLEMIATSAPQQDILDRLTRLIEAQLPGVMCSILLLDDDGLHLRHGAAPNLPEEYVRAIDGVRVGPNVGSCGTSIHRRESVIVTDILEDPLWVDFSALAHRHGLRSCWSAPIFAPHGAVLGTFAVYSGIVRAPSSADMRLIDLATRIAGIAIERQQAQERIQHMAHHDELTGLPNRTLLSVRLDQAIAHAQRHERCVTVAFVDLDNFKLINDSLGHSAGDELLKIMSERMLRCVRNTDSVVRLGGDEFVIVLPDQPKVSEMIEPTLQQIITSIAHPIRLGDRNVQISCSMGLAFYPADGADTDALLMNADAAMYRAKEMGRNNFQFYRSEMNARSRERLSLQEGLRNAMARDELFLLYQPQVDLQSGRICGVEALIRWQHPELGLVSPATFIPLAEETGMIVPIGDWVLRTACRQCKAWQDAGLPRITMSVNVSARQFKDQGWLVQMAQTLRQSGLDPEYLELEVTESLVVQDSSEAIKTMQQLQAMGVRLAIDDFGTGYSSLGALKTFPVNRLKIDQSFVRDITTDHQDKAIVMAVILLGHRLNLEVIAEGVETDRQLDFLREHGCDQMQGFHFSKPVPADAIARLLLTRKSAFEDQSISLVFAS